MGTPACSDFLFAEPNVWFGFARLLDLWGQFDSYNISRTPAEADARALLNDWLVVGEDLSAAFEKVLRECIESDAGHSLREQLEREVAAH